VLPAAHRLRSSAEFAAVTRSGRRNRSGDVVVYLAGAAPVGGASSRLVSDQTTATSANAAQAGLIVSRKVGGSVVRHRVSRRLRAQLASRLAELPAGARVVVRALPSAAEATSETLGQQLDAAFEKLTADGSRRAEATR
jgi:ribonuclease P protein component